MGCIGLRWPEIPLAFIQEGVNVNTQVYLNLVRDHALSRARESFPSGYVFTQDGTPSHASKLTQQWR